MAHFFTSGDPVGAGVMNNQSQLDVEQKLTKIQWTKSQNWKINVGKRICRCSFCIRPSSMVSVTPPHPWRTAAPAADLPIITTTTTTTTIIMADLPRSRTNLRPHFFVPTSFFGCIWSIFSSKSKHLFQNRELVLRAKIIKNKLIIKFPLGQLTARPPNRGHRIRRRAKRRAFVQVSSGYSAVRRKALLTWFNTILAKHMTVHIQISSVASYILNNVTVRWKRISRTKIIFH